MSAGVRRPRRGQRPRAAVAPRQRHTRFPVALRRLRAKNRRQRPLARRDAAPEHMKLAQLRKLPDATQSADGGMRGTEAQDAARSTVRRRTGGVIACATRSRRAALVVLLFGLADPRLAAHRGGHVARAPAHCRSQPRTLRARRRRRGHGGRRGEPDAVRRRPRHRQLRRACRRRGDEGPGARDPRQPASSATSTSASGPRSTAWTPPWRASRSRSAARS